MKKNLPDVASEPKSPSQSYAALDWVGMESIELPVQFSAANLQVPAKVDAKVSLDKKDSRGIHMSRLYLIAQEKLSKSKLTLELLGQVTQEFLKTHEDLSTAASVKVHFEAPLLRPALKSANEAWRSYPVVLSAVHIAGVVKYFAEVVITYSSTCPASAALSRQLIQEQFQKDFAAGSLDFAAVHRWLGSTDGIVATPHAQRSFARVKVAVGADFNYVELIELVEETLQTAVQAAVKREDEQEFALRNGQNLMFCEDAARRVKEALRLQTQILDYVGEFNHVESLHPHSAVARMSKGQDLREF